MPRSPPPPNESLLDPTQTIYLDILRPTPVPLGGWPLKMIEYFVPATVPLIATLHNYRAEPDMMKVLHLLPMEPDAMRALLAWMKACCQAGQRRPLEIPNDPIKILNLYEALWALDIVEFNTELERKFEISLSGLMRWVPVFQTAYRSSGCSELRLIFLEESRKAAARGQMVDRGLFENTLFATRSKTWERWRKLVDVMMQKIERREEAMREWRTEIDAMDQKDGQGTDPSRGKIRVGLLKRKLHIPGPVFSPRGSRS